jgi:hypothetical protein
MQSRAGCCFSALIIAVSLCPAQPPHYVEIKLPREVDSEHMFIRYTLDGDFGGWVEARPGMSSYFIDANGTRKTPARIKALLYAPGCAIQTLDLPVSETGIQRFSFVCRPVPSIAIAGALSRVDGLEADDIAIQAKYVARWAASFLGLSRELVTDIPVGETKYISTEGHFRLSLPDLAEDPSASAPDHPGELQIIAKNTSSGTVVAQLIPGRQLIGTRMGGFKIQSSYPPEIAFTPCFAVRRPSRDANGFAIRVPSGCER